MAEEADNVAEQQAGIATAPSDEERIVHDSWLKAGLDPDAAFDATKATRDTAGANVVAQISAATAALFAEFGARMDAFGARMDAFEVRMDAFEARMDVFEARMDARMEVMGAHIEALRVSMQGQIDALQRQIVTLQWMTGILGLLMSGCLVALLLAFLDRSASPVAAPHPAVVAPAVDPVPAPVPPDSEPEPTPAR